MMMKSLAIIITVFVFARGGNNEVSSFYSSYNPVSGMFVAPVKGVYLFWANLLNYGDDWNTIILKKEGQELASGFSGFSSRSGTATINTIAELEKGDHVWLTHEGNAAATGRRFSYFGGALLFK